MLNEVHVAGRPQAGIQRCERCEEVLAARPEEVGFPVPMELDIPDHAATSYFEVGALVVEEIGGASPVTAQGPTCVARGEPAPLPPTRLYKAPDGRLVEAIEVTLLTRPAVVRFVEHQWGYPATERGATLVEVAGLPGGRSLAAGDSDWLVKDPRQPEVRLVRRADFLTDYEEA